MEVNGHRRGVEAASRPATLAIVDWRASFPYCHCLTLHSLAKSYAAISQVCFGDAVRWSPRHLITFATTVHVISTPAHAHLPNWPNVPAGMSVYALMQPQSSDDSPEFFRQLIERRFELALTTLPTRQEHTDAGLVADLGDIIIHLLSMVSKIADEIVDDRRIKQRAYGAMVEDRTARRYTLAMSLQDVDASHRILKDMQSTLKSTVDGFSQAWQRPPVLHPSAGHARPVSMSVSVSEHIPSPSSTFSRSSGGQSVHDPSRDPRLEGHQPVLIEPARIDKPSPASEQNYSRPSERSESGADNDALADPDMDALRNRGKGTYTFIFERNCMFRQHMDKHKKPYKCTKPGCPNKDGFARKDQLERHMQNVKHDVP
ncbi:hypothetical protein VDGE_01566 [Verticillium dahliae]|uniref:C2H2-type domain-containing protein n=1 Tax=Verticillium dahliae TaxID=27337 RepID=A0A444RX91_VERDA|nr:hypothetical protein VDGE_01566 [Verticillium dahliae]